MSERDGRKASTPTIRFINLDRATERCRFMEEQAHRLGLHFERVPAVAAADIAADKARALNHAWERPLTPAELGCFLSHHTIWLDVARGKAPVLVLEDDVMLSARLAEFLPLLAGLPDADFLNIESFDRRRFVARHSKALAEGLAAVRVYRDKSGSAAYLLWPSGARKLLRKAERGAAPVDAFLHGLRSLLSWQSEPALAMQLHLLEARGVAVPIPSGSSIQTPRTRLPWRWANAAFHARRLRTQGRLACDHLMRLFGRRYRRVDIAEGDFSASDQSPR
ncbi:glycosyltransferase family 25 protein [Aureimonas psammosilenae]|uniref:glycosyltransferase family 25 protein n=1 Tax=Aureimonas psammosilenae TaxID=2495496 RepID=UPI00186A6E9D|nr:glycosyltransferase family 25 protein [Aureimonas psammosilenae]